MNNSVIISAFSISMCCWKKEINCFQDIIYSTNDYNSKYVFKIIIVQWIIKKLYAIAAALVSSGFRVFSCSNYVICISIVNNLSPTVTSQAHTKNNVRIVLKSVYKNAYNLYQHSSHVVGHMCTICNQWCRTSRRDHWN